MSGFDFEELGRLAEIYRDAGTTNPILALRVAADLSDPDKSLLRLIIDKNPRDRVRAWEQEARSKAPGSDDGARLSPEEYRNIARRDFTAVNKTALLDFRAKLNKL